MDLEKWQKLGTEITEIDLEDISLPTALSLRVSTEKQEKNESLENQEIEGLEYIKNKKYNLVKIYKDVASGGSYVREGMNELIEDINNGLIKRVVLVNAERLARDILFAMNFSNICQTNKVIIEFIDSGKKFFRFNLMELMEYILTFFKSHAQREQIGIDVKRRMATKLKNGQRMGGMAPFGYRWENKTLLIVEEEAEVVKKIFSDFLKGDTRAEIARTYNKLETFISRVLKNPVYKGYNKFGEKHIDKKTGKCIYRKEFVTTKGNHPAIIDEDTWNKANELLKNNFIPKIKNEDNPTFLFSGLIYCYCGCKMYGWSRSRKADEKDHYYSCATRNLRNRRNKCTNSSKPVKEFEELIIRELIKISNEFEKYDIFEERNDNLEKISYLENEKTKLIKNKKELLKLVGVFSIEDIKEKSNNVDISINEINKKIEELKKYIENSEKRGIIDIKEIFKEVLLNYQSNNRMKLKKILPLLINRIEFVNDFRFKIILNI